MSIILLALIAILGIISIAIYLGLSWGIVTVNFWEWFIIPIFPDLPHITVFQAIGLFYFISLFKTQATYVVEEMEDKTRGWISIIITPWVFLLIGYLFKSIFL